MGEQSGQASGRPQLHILRESDGGDATGAWNSTPEGVVAVDRRGPMALLAEMAARILRTARKGLIGEPAGALAPHRPHPAHRPAADVSGAAPYERGRGQPRHIPSSREGATGFPFEISLSPTTIRGGGFVRGRASDSGASDAAKNNRREGWDRLREVVDNAPDALWQADASLRIEFASDRLAMLTGRRIEDLVGYGVREFLSTDSRAAIDRSLRDCRELEDDGIKTGVRRWEVELIDPAGTAVPVEVSLRPLRDAAGDILGFVGSMRDLDGAKRLPLELAELEGKVVAAQRLETAGRLASGFAHDFNNLLTVILGSLREIEELAADRPDLADRVAVCLHAVGRGEALARSMLSLGREGGEERRPADINAVLHDIEPILRQAAGSGVRLRIVPADELWPCDLIAGRFQNAIVNLVVNARDAMPGGGAVMVLTANEEVDELEAASSGRVPGRYATVSVVDSGCGMPPEIARRATEPFFTTKPDGKGTGLGLSMVNEFAKALGGHVAIYSRVGVGTVVTLCLPARATADLAEAAVGVAGAKPAAIRPAAAGAGARRTVLVVEDDADVRALVRCELDALGYRVVEAAECDTASRLLREDGSIAVLLADLGVVNDESPGGFIHRASEIAPGLRVVYMTGGSGEEVADGNNRPHPARLLRKPFEAIDLAMQIRTALEES